MSLSITMFLFGLIFGIVLACVIAWIIFTKKSRITTGLLLTADLERKELRETLAQSSSKLAVLQERATYVDQLKDELAKTRSALDDKKEEIGELSAKLVGVQVHNERTVEFFNQRIADLSAVHNTMKETFASVSKDALVKNADLINSSFKQSMEHFFKENQKDRLVINENLASVIAPLKESLLSVDKKVEELESSRQGAYAGIKEQIDSLLKSQSSLQSETQKLARALSAPTTRGRWGEMQLRRVVELSGMSAHCDFVEQQNIGEGEAVLRPDMIITLPRNKKIVIDAKAPLELMGLDDASYDYEEKDGVLLAASLKRHLMLLKKKSYHSFVGQSPEFVVMFLPGEAFLYRALKADPNLLEYAAQNEIIVATPVTLVALLKAIAFGFRQEAIASNIEEVRRLSQQLIDRINKVSVHFDKLGRSLKQSTDAYNQTLASLDSRVLVTAKKLAEIKSLAPESDISEELESGPIFLDAVPREAHLRNVAIEDEL